MPFHSHSSSPSSSSTTSPSTDCAMFSDLIADWLSTLPSNSSAEGDSPLRPSPPRPLLSDDRRKRRLNLDSSDAAVMAHARRGTNSPQKRARSEQMDETDQASRFGYKGVQTPRSNRAFSPAYEATLSVSEIDASRSNNSSPQKLLFALEITDRGAVRVCQLEFLESICDSPARDFTASLRRISRGVGVLSPVMRPELQPYLQTPEFDWAQDDHYFSESRAWFGRTPSPSAVRRLTQNANDCSEQGHSKTVWNLEVHQKILEMALRPNEECDLKHLVRFTGM